MGRPSSGFVNAVRGRIARALPPVGAQARDRNPPGFAASRRSRNPCGGVGGRAAPACASAWGCLVTASPSRPPLVLVTGGAGVIGSPTVDFLLAEGERVRLVDDLRTGRMANLPVHPVLEFVRGDIRDTALLERVMQGVTHVLHRAAQVSVERSVQDPVSSCSENVLGYVAVLDAARRAGARWSTSLRQRFTGIPARCPWPNGSGRPAVALRTRESRRRGVRGSLRAAARVSDAGVARLQRLRHPPGSRVAVQWGDREIPHPPGPGRSPGSARRRTAGAGFCPRAGRCARQRPCAFRRDPRGGECRARGVGERAGTRLPARTGRPTSSCDRFVPEPTGAIRFSRAGIGRLREEPWLPGIGLEEGLEELTRGVT